MRKSEKKQDLKKPERQTMSLKKALNYYVLTSDARRLNKFKCGSENCVNVNIVSITTGDKHLKSEQNFCSVN